MALPLSQFSLFANNPLSLSENIFILSFNYLLLALQSRCCFQWEGHRLAMLFLAGYVTPFTILSIYNLPKCSLFSSNTFFFFISVVFGRPSLPPFPPHHLLSWLLLSCHHPLFSIPFLFHLAIFNRLLMKDMGGT